MAKLNHYQVAEILKDNEPYHSYLDSESVKRYEIWQFIVEDFGREMGKEKYMRVHVLGEEA